MSEKAGEKLRDVGNDIRNKFQRSASQASYAQLSQHDHELLSTIVSDSAVC